MSKSNSIQTYLGYRFDFKDLESNHISEIDVAHSLSNQCRWTGHTSFFYSIAQHTVHMADIAFKQYGPYKAFEALHHDDSEYVLADLSRPAKVLCPDYNALQVSIEAYIARHWGLPEKMSNEIAEIDNRMLITEYFQLVDRYTQTKHESLIEYAKQFPPYEDIELVPWSSEVAFNWYLDRHEKYQTTLH